MTTKGQTQHWMIWAVATCMLLLWLPTLIRQLDQLELTSFDFRQRLVSESRTHSGVVLVELDDAVNASEVKAAFGRFPFRRDLYGYVARYLSRANAKRTLFDVAFTGGGDDCHPVGDAFLSQATEKEGTVFSVLPLLNNPVHLSAFPQPLLLTFLQAIRPSVYTQALPKAFPTALSQGIEMPIETLLHSKMQYAPAGAVHYDANKRVRRVGLFNTFFMSNERPTPAGETAQHKGVYQAQKNAPMLNFPTMPMMAIAGKANTIQWHNRHQLNLAGHPLDLKGEDLPIIRWYGNVKPPSALTSSEDVREQYLGKIAQHKEQAIYPRYSFWDVVRSELAYTCRETPALNICQQVNLQGFQPLPLPAFQQKYVLIGMTAGSFTQDNHNTLYHAQYPGVYIQANILDNMLHNDFVARSPWRFSVPIWLYGDSISLVTWLTCAAMAFLTFWACSRWQQMRVALVFCFTLMVGYSMACVGAYLYQNLWLNWTYPMVAMVLSTFVTYLVRFKETEKHKEQLRFAFGKYVSPSVMNRIESHPEALQLGGERRVITALFCDIRGFTTYSESHTPEEVQHLLTEYFSMMNHIILNEYGGTINKLIGDAIMAYWGFPLASEQDAEQAVKAAMAMQAALEQWRQKNPMGPDLRIGIGLNTGSVMVGNVGSEDFMDFTIIGDAVNLASRLESATKKMGVPILISASTYEQVKHTIMAEPLGDIEVAGKEQKISVYTPTREA